MRPKRGLTFMPKQKPFCDQPGSLLVATRKLLMQDPRSTLDIHKQCGLPYFWLVQFKSNRSTSPSVDRVQYLYEFLAEKKLAV